MDLSTALPQSINDRLVAGARGCQPAAVAVRAGDGDGGEGEPGAEADTQVSAGRAGQGRQEGAAVNGAERAEQEAGTSSPSTAPRIKRGPTRQLHFRITMKKFSNFLSLYFILYKPM